MGILNVTPDSFSDGGCYLSSAAAVEAALRMLDEGADMIDVGGESSRPGAPPVPLEEELRRVVPVIGQLRSARDCCISVDTMKAEVARQAIQAGARIVNDISALTADPGMRAVARQSGAGLVLMHMRGTPATMQQNPQYTDAPGEVTAYLAERVRALAAEGMDPARMAVDPGIGFGKSLEHNLAILAQLERLVALGRPVLVGLSRKSFLGRITGRELPFDRLAAGLGAAAFAIRKGASILRVHDVKETCDMARVVDMLRNEEKV